MLYYNRIDLNEGTDSAKSNNIEEYTFVTIIFFIHGFKFENPVCLTLFDNVVY